MTRKQFLKLLFLGLGLSQISLLAIERINLSQPALAQNQALTVSAAISLKDVLNEIKTEYQKKDPKTIITYNFGSSGSLQQQIEQGASVDLFISAANKQMNALESKNMLLPGSRKIFTRNQIVLITPKTENRIQKFSDLTKPSVTKIAIGEPKSVPAGQYGEEAFKFYKILDKVQPKLIYGKDVRQVLTYVETGNVDAGLVYLTDAKTSNQVKVVATAPPNSHTPIVYLLAILKESKNTNSAQAFGEFLTSTQAKNILKKYGFVD
ncbi:molybdate ABC transporter substrate-binding protein [Synechocystis sp. LKSZ1]|uniref:molybdate ABC transporter substrate-binding protein n=1 Tax=Synechocystis sp. LKSZ1 TaxID=3144951 RepID=UPI00336C1F87